MDGWKLKEARIDARMLMSDDEGRKRRIGQRCLFMSLMVATRPSLPVWSGLMLLKYSQGRYVPCSSRSLVGDEYLLRRRVTSEKHKRQSRHCSIIWQ